MPSSIAIRPSIPYAEKAAANGVAPLDGTSKVPAVNLPSYVDDVLEYANLAALPGIGATGIIYVTLDDNKTYRWTGTVYAEVSSTNIGGTPLDYRPVSWNAATSSPEYRNIVGNQAGDFTVNADGNLILESGNGEIHAEQCDLLINGIIATTPSTFGGIVALNAGLSAALPVTSGGTGITAVATGNVLYATGANVWAAGSPDTAGLVAKTGTQTIAGAKTFSDAMVLSSTLAGTSATFSGNVNIGTSPPASLLSVRGTSNDSISGTNAHFIVAGSSTNGIHFGTVASSPFGAYIQGGAYNSVNGVQYPLLLQPIGNGVAIGTLDPAGYKLNVNGTTNISGALTGTTATFSAGVGYRLDVGGDTDTAARFGRTVLGLSTFADFAWFSHTDMSTAGQFALVQSSTGETFLNSASGKPLNFRINNVDAATLTASLLTSYVPFAGTSATFINQVAGNNLRADGANSYLGGLQSAGNPTLTIQPTDAARFGLVLLAKASQTAPLLEWRNSSDVAMGSIGATGAITGTSATFSGAIQVGGIVTGLSHATFNGDVNVINLIMSSNSGSFRGGSGVNLANNRYTTWSNDATEYGTKDVSVYRVSAGVLGIGTGVASGAGALTCGSITGTSATFSGNVAASQSQNTPLGMQIDNLNAGTSALTVYKAGNDAARYAWFGIGSSVYTVLPALQNRAFILAQGATSGINLYNEGANPIIFTIDDVEKARIGGDGNATFAGAITGTSATFSGPVLHAVGSVGAPTIAFTSYPAYGAYFNAATGMVFAHNGAEAFGVKSSQIAMPSTTGVVWCSSTMATSGDVFLNRNAGAGKLKLTTDGGTTYGELTLGSLIGTSATLSQRITTGVSALIDAANIATNATLGNTFTVTLAGNRTMDAPTNAVAGQRLLYQIKQDATGTRTITWNTIFRFPDGLAPSLTPTGNFTDHFTFVYNAVDTKWDCVNMLGGGAKSAIDMRGHSLSMNTVGVGSSLYMDGGDIIGADEVDITTLLGVAGMTLESTGIHMNGLDFNSEGGDIDTGAVRALDNLICSTAGKGLQLKSGTGARAGEATLVAGTITVTNTTVTANTRVYAQRKTAGGTIGMSLTWTVSAGASFTLNSDNPLDTSIYAYFLVEIN